MNKCLLTTGIIVATMAASPYALSEMSNQAIDKSVEEQNVNIENSKALSDTQKKETDKAIDTQINKEKEKLKIIDESILEGFKKVDEAMVLIGQKDKEKAAINALQIATGKFDVALAADPNLALMPIDTRVVFNEFLATPDGIRESIQLAIDLLKDSKVVDARYLLNPMIDELGISTTYLPMDTYPDAIKQATKTLIDGKKEESIAMLETALSTLIIKKSIIPLGIIRAEDLLKTASNMDKEKYKNDIKKYLKDAEDQLEISTLLGYTDKHSVAYEDIKTQIKALEKEVAGPNVVEKLYEQLKSSFSNLIDEHSNSEEMTSEQSKNSSNNANKGK